MNVARAVCLLFTLSLLLGVRGAHPIQLPQDPAAVVVALEYRGGRSSRKARSGPHLVVRGDGRVAVRDRFFAAYDIETTLPSAEIVDLLEFIMNKRKFAEIETEDLHSAIAAQNERKTPKILDAAATVISVTTNDTEHEVSCYGLGLYAPRLPDVEPLQDLYSIEQRLVQLIARLRLGGAEGLAEVLTSANERLAREHPEVAPLQANQLHSAYPDADGKLRIRFLQKSSLRGGRVSVRVTREPRGMLTVNVSESSP